MAVLSASSLPRRRGLFAVSPSDPAIKLFGKTIPAPPGTDNAAQPVEFQDEFHGECDEDGFSPRGVHDELRASCGSGIGSEDENCLGFSMKEEKDQSEVLECAEKPGESSKNLSPTLEGKGKALRRLHDPIPCPRCQSLDTKFCYFNNYNVNQPRHFCKHCQRYWTAGGTLRNVPVGAGKRKCKHPNAQQRHDFGMRSVVYRKASPDDAESLLSYSLPEQITNVKPSCQSASQITICAGKDGSFSSGSVSSHAQLLGTASSNGSTSATEWVQERQNSSIDFPSHARDSYKGHSSNASANASTTELPELSLRSCSAKAPEIQRNASSSDSERSTFRQDKSITTPENISNAQLLPVLAVPWPVLYQMYPAQIPSCTPAPTFPLCPSTGNTLQCQWAPFPGPVWTFPSAVAPCATAAAPTSLAKRPAVEASSLSSPKTPRIHASDSAASSSTMTTLETVEMMRKS